MNIMSRYAWRSMWRNRTRTLVTIVGIILSAAMFAAVATLGVSLLDYMIDLEVYSNGDYFIRFDYASDEQVETIRGREEVSEIGTAKTIGYTTFYTIRDGEELSQTCVLAAGDADFFDRKTVVLEKGRLPRNGDEIVIPRNVQEYLKSSGLPHDLGDIVELEVVPELSDEDFPVETQPGRAFTRSYMIVGISEDDSSRLDDWSLTLMHVLTYDDGTAEQVLWSRCFVKTEDPMDAYALEQAALAPSYSVNSNLLIYYGASDYTNINEIIFSICAVLMGIILVGSVSLIYNAFSISLSERTRDFGLLTSIGATKKQLRRSVYHEALLLSVIGIPAGVLCGYLGIAATLYLTNDLITGLLMGGSSLESGIRFDAEASMPAFGCAALVALLTVLISARLPLRRALKTDPIPAIRQTMDYKIPKKGVKTSRISARLFGVPGLMAGKYYRVSRKKYRATVISLTISVVLFLTSFTFGQIIQGIADSNANTYNYDIEIYNITNEQAELIRSRDDVAQSALVEQWQYAAMFEEEDFAPEYLTAMEDLTEEWELSGQYELVKYVDVYYLEDAVFRSHLEAQGIDPEPYFDESARNALICDSRILFYRYGENTTERVVYATPVLSELGQELNFFDTSLPQEALNAVDRIHNAYSWEHWVYEGNPMWVVQFWEELSEESFAANPYLQEDGRLYIVRIPRGEVADYYFYDPVTQGLAPEPICTGDTPEAQPVIRVLDRAQELPFGVREHSHWQILNLVMPLSKYPQGGTPSLVLTARDHSSLTQWLDEQEFYYSDHLSSQLQYRNLVTMINVFTYGFIVLISLICVCNVFNTISTNIALRRRDFGMLRSIGMQNRELNRMMALECLRYGVQSLTVGLPLGLLTGYGIYVLLDVNGMMAYELPVGAMVMAALSVFAVVFITMLYAMGKLRKDDPITAIRMDNL